MRAKICFALNDPAYSKANTLLFARSIWQKFLRIYFIFVTNFYSELHFYQVMQTIWYTFMDYKIFCNPRIRTSSLCHLIHFNIIVPCRPMFSELYFCFGCPNKNSVGISLRPHSWYMPRLLNYFWLITIMCTEDYISHKVIHYLISFGLLFFCPSWFQTSILVLYPRKFSDFVFRSRRQNQVSHPYNRTGKYLVSYILILMCLDGIQKIQKILYRTVGGKYYMIIICPWFLLARNFGMSV